MKPLTTLSQAMRDPELFGSVFAAESYWPWHAVGKLLSGETLDARETELFHACTGRSRVPTQPVRRLILLAGRRAGKDRFASAVAVHQAALVADWSAVLSAGEQGVVVMIGVDKKQARILRRYCAGLLSKPLLAAEIVRDTDEMIEFRNGAALEIASNDAATIRGRSAIAVVGTEACYWQTDDERASSDEEVVGAAEPAMAMTPDGGLLLMQSSVYRRRGYMHRRFKELWGNDDAEDMCWLATSQTMNPALPEKVVSDALSRDFARGQAEFNSVWRDDVSGYLSRELIEAATDRGIVVRPPARGIRYYGFADPSGGVNDSYCAAVAHAEGESVILDSLVEIRAPLNPAEATATISEMFKQYHLSEVHGDRYSAGFVVDAFSKCGIKYIHSDLDRSAIYANALSLFTSGRARILDNSRLASQLSGLERHALPSGKDRIDHGLNGHDDAANAACGAMSQLVLKRSTYDSTFLSWVSGPDDQTETNENAGTGATSKPLYQHPWFRRY